MIKKRCYLCGGKLVAGKCVECGLDNTRNDRKTYRLNCTTAEFARDRKLKENTKTTLSEEQHENYVKPAPRKKEKKTVQRKDVNKKVRRNTKSTVEGKKLSASKIIKIIISAVIALNILPVIIGACADGIHDLIEKKAFMNSVMESSWEEEQDTPYYHDDLYELSQEGEEFEIELTQGIYKIGTFIPEGIYYLERVDGNGFCKLVDNENGIYNHWWLSEHKENEKDGAVQSAEDVRLYQDGYLKVEDNVKIRLTSTCAQMEKMVSTVENPLSEKAYLQEGEEYIAGEDFPAGIYDFTSEKEFAGISVNYNEQLQSYWISTLDSNGNIFKNVYLPEGATVSVHEGAPIFIPAKDIELGGCDFYYNNGM